MLAERQRITADILKYMETQNYSLSPKAKRAHSLDSWVFRYINSAGNWDNIKIEINYSMRESVVLYSALASRTRDTEFGTSRIDELTNHRIRTDLLPVIRRKEYFSLDEAKSRVKDFVSELMILTLREEEFVTCFRNEEYRPELLFEDATIVERIEQHPMALWKMRDTGGIDLGEPR